MSLSVNRDRVKQKCAITDTSYDASIDALITETVPAIEYALSPVHLASSDTRLVATLNLGATEVVAGELMAQIAREPGAFDSIVLGTLSVKPPEVDLADPSGLRAQGLTRLTPFFQDGLGWVAGVTTTGPRVEEES